jgi:hypothetical protein
MFEDQEENKSKIDEAKKSLYSREPDSAFIKKRHELKSKDTGIETGWKDEVKKEGYKGFPFVKVLLGALIFFVLAAGFAAYKFFGGSNLISGDNIDITISGPVSVAGGDSLPLDIKIINQNNVSLNAVNLQIEFPDGTRQPDDLSLDMKRYSEALGSVDVGKSIDKLVKAVLFGEENSKQTIKVTVEYMVPGSNAIFYKTKDYEIIISSSPINLSVTGVNEINAGQSLDYNVEITSNSLSVIKNLILKVDYPFGFNFKSSIPQSVSLDNSVWAIGDLEPGSKRDIKISGSVQGQDGEQRVFKFTVGTPDKSNSKSIATPFTIYSSTVSIKKPFIGINLAINGSTSKEVVVGSGQAIRADLLWQNNLAVQVYDVSVQVKFRGGILNKSSFQVNNGFYNSLDNSVTFDKQKNNSLASIAPGDQGDTSFTFSSFSSASKTGSSFINPDIYMDVSVTGKRAQGDNVQQEVLYSDSKRIKIAADLKLLSAGYHTVGPFENSGPIPPKVEKETTYTVTWTVSDLLNDINNGKVSTVLSPNVKWLGFTSPSSENITYSPLGGQVVWDVGNIKAGTGITAPARTASFMVSITPSLSQVGTNPSLIGEATLSGTDSFTGVTVSDTKPSLNTDIRSDPNFLSESGKVVQ